MSCTDTWAHGSLDKLLTGELEASEFGRLHKHVAGCNSCSTQYDRITRVDEQLARAEGMSSQRVALMQGSLLDRAELRNEQERAKAGKQRWWMPALGFGLAAAVALAVAHVPKADDSRYQARGTAANSAFGIRAFCVSGTKVIAESLPGGKLKCSEGSALQLTYTAPRAANLSINVNGATAMFPAEGGAAKIVSGVDVPLDFSTPVTREWLSQPALVTATFESEGKTEKSVITVEP
jgi:hypothetical protein